MASDDSPGRAVTPDPNDDENIYPTHTCFDDTVDYLNMRARTGASKAELLSTVTVHAVLVAPDGDRFAHAWIEYRGKVIDSGIYKGERVFVEYQADEYRRIHTIEDETRYSIVDAVRLAQERGFPPWEERYRALSGRATGKAWVVGKVWPCAK